MSKYTWDQLAEMSPAQLEGIQDDLLHEIAKTNQDLNTKRAKILFLQDHLAVLKGEED